VWLEKLPNQKSMNKKTPLAASETGIHISPAYPKPGHRILVDLRHRLSLAEGYEIAFTRLGSMFGLPKSTLSNWFNHFENPALQFLFGLLERLPESERNAFIQSQCRILPTLDHPSLAHEPAMTDHLRSLLRRPVGLTLISGPSDYARHFLLSAFGHGFCRHDEEHRPVTGLICKSPGRLVPLHGAFYLATDLNPKVVLWQVNHLWPSIRNAATSMVLLDGVLGGAPHKRADILKLALSKHVVLADDFGQTDPLGVKGTLLTRLEVSGSPASALQVQILR